MTDTETQETQETQETETHDELEDFTSFSEPIARGISELGWSKPMPVQARVIPIMRKQNDLIVQAVTGSGKTGAFGLPIVENIDPELRAIQALILAPTRELAGQIAKELKAMGVHVGVEATAIYGGTAYGPQLDALDRGVQVIAGTPGRVLDHLGNGRMKLDKLRYMIFDEADELLSLGFWPDMREIKSYLPDKRLTGLFSATMPERVLSLSRQFLNEPEFISLTEGGVRSPEEIEHYHYIVSAQEKDSVLARILEYEEPDSAIIFCNTRDDVRFVSGYLKRRGVDADMIQGDMSQAAREQVMKRIKAGSLRYLVATDVAARGIDISDLSHVIAYAAPDSPESYLHRTGRTGRAGKKGIAISLVSGRDIGNFKFIQNANRMKIPERSIPTDDEVRQRIAQRYEVQIEHAIRHLGDREREIAEQRFLPVVEHLNESDEGRRELAAILYSSLAKVAPKTKIAEEEETPDVPDNVANTEEPGRRGGPDRGGDRPRRSRRRGPRR
jgi:ATP-dependent RNA helicase DeaD